MARILTDESTLTRKRRTLIRESGVLQWVLYVEAGITALLLLAGGVLWLAARRTGVLILGAMTAFLTVGHFIKIRENRREQRFVEAGLKGEITVTQRLQEVLGNDTYILNDVTVKGGRRRAQIDHLVISPKAIFVIETKNWRGAVSGDEKERRWIQVRQPGDKPVSVSNPIIQNRQHVEALAGFLRARGVDWPDLVSVIVTTSPSSTFTVANRTVPVVRPVEVGELIRSHGSARTYGPAAVDAVINHLMRRAR
jgi:hypothetical protein